MHFFNNDPNELDIRKENKGTCEASFWDLSLEVLDRTFTSKLFNNRYAFPFYINHKHYLDSYISPKIFYASVGSEIHVQQET